MKITVGNDRNDDVILLYDRVRIALPAHHCKVVGRVVGINPTSSGTMLEVAAGDRTFNVGDYSTEYVGD